MTKETGLEFFAKKVSETLPYILRTFAASEKNAFTKGTISLPQMLILEYLNKEKGCMMGDIARMLSISMSGATGLADRMLKTGLLKRSRSARDRRVVNIYITPKGERAAKNVLRQRINTIKKMFSMLTEKERKKYLQILEKVKKQSLKMRQG